MTSRKAIPRYVFILAMLVGVWLVTEVACFLAFYFVERRTCWSESLRADLRKISQSAAGTAPDNTADRAGDFWFGDYVEVLHPYFGFVPDPARNPRVTSLGFLSDDPASIQTRSDKAILVGLFGGSFAHDAYMIARESLVTSLRESGHEVKILNYSAGGYKQPQQLMILSYLLSLGAEFDVVINIDGFNEVALPAVENGPQGTNPFYPRNWAMRTRGIPDVALLRRYGRAAILAERRAGAANALLSSGLFRSAVCSIAWRTMDRWWQRSQFELQSNERQSAGAGQSFAQTGPPYDATSQSVFLDDLARVWSQSSLEMHQLCEANGILYVHVLQPNQYLPGSKPISAAEARIAINENQPYRLPAMLGYPHLIARGPWLRERGVLFLDATQIFAKEPATLYRDDCCHLNEKGYRMFGAVVSAAIKEHYTRK